MSSKEVATIEGDDIPPIQGSMKTVAAFSSALLEHESNWKPLLPQNVSPEKFHAIAVEAVRQTPKLLQCSARSLFGAVARAAKDGLMPDGREGVIAPYKGEAQWNPMAWGLRKRARELDRIIVDAQVVREKDEFEWEQGDRPFIRHKPSLDENPGDLIRVYAIFRKGEEILHREVLRKPEVDVIRKQSKAPDSLMWKTFPSEGWKKVAVRRGFKSVPVSPEMQEIIARDDEVTGLSIPEETDQASGDSTPPETVGNVLDRFAAEDAEIVEGSTADAEAEADAQEHPDAPDQPSTPAETEAAPEAPVNGKGGVRYSASTSAQNLKVILEILDGPLTAKDLKETVEGYAEIVGRLVPGDRTKAIAALKAKTGKATRGKDALAKLVTLWEQHEADATTKG